MAKLNYTPLLSQPGASARLERLERYAVQAMHGILAYTGCGQRSENVAEAAWMIAEAMDDARERRRAVVSEEER